MTEPSKDGLKWYEPILLSLLPPLAVFFAKSLLYSCREVEIIGREEAEAAINRAEGRAVFVTWHQRVSYQLRHLAPRGLTVMISQSRDGEYGARIARWAGAKNVRGSSTRGGKEALRELISLVKRGGTAGMLADGPLGPPRVAKVGSVIIAKEAQAPIIPVVWGGNRCWCLNSWDRNLIPKPFSKIVIKYPPPIWVHSDASRSEIEGFRRKLEDSLNEASKWCDDYFGVNWPWNKRKNA